MVTTVVSGVPTLTSGRPVPVMTMSNVSEASARVSSIAITDAQSGPRLGMGPAGMVMVVMVKEKSPGPARKKVCNVQLETTLMLWKEIQVVFMKWYLQYTTIEGPKVTKGAQLYLLLCIYQV